MYTRRYTEVATEISQVSRKRGRGAVPPVRIEKAAFSPIDRSSRRWQLHREIGSHVGNGVGKLLSGMSAGLLTNRRKETTWEENIRESIGRRKEYWPRYEIAGFFYCVKIENIGFCPSTIVTIFWQRSKSERFGCIEDRSLGSFGKDQLKFVLLIFPFSLDLNLKLP